MRHQLPVYSPLSLSAIIGAAAAGGGSAERRALEAELSGRFDADAVILTASGTHALQLALTSLRRETVGECVVALPAYSCFDLVTAAVGAGVRIRFYDVDPESLTPDLDTVRSVIRQGVAAVVAGNLYGYPIDWRSLREVCGPAEVPVIEDAAQGVGTTSMGRRGGALGDASVLSFGRGKGWTGGGGGALLLRGDRLPWREEGLPEGGSPGVSKAFGVSLAAWALGRPRLYGLPSSIPGLGLGETRYTEPSAPAGMSSFSVGLVRRTAEAAGQAVAARRRVAGELMAAIGATSDVLVEACRPVGGGEAASFLRLPLLAADPEHAGALVEQGGHLGIARGYPRPLPQLSAAQAWMEGPSGDLPGSRRLALGLVTLPTHGWVEEADMSSLLDLLATSG